MALTAYRHPKPRGAQGLCVGARTDLPVDPRKAKRLAHRLRAAQRRAGLAKLVWTSELRRAVDVGRWLRRWGWCHRIDPRLRELDFGAWDGRPWREIPEPEIRAWSEGLAEARPGGEGETVPELLRRVQAVCSEAVAQGVSLLVTHGGWLSALQWQAQRGNEAPRADRWPAAPGYGRGLPSG